jgi:hypothetical protein
MSTLSKANLLFFLVWPFGSLIRSLNRFKEPWSGTIFLLFCIYFGYVFIYEDPSLGKFGADSASYVQKLTELHENPIPFSELVKSFYSEKDLILDIYQPFMTWLISMITADPRILFAVFAGIFGFFFMNNLWIIFNMIQGKVGLILIMLLATYALINPIWNINGVRMYTAAQVFLYGNLRFFLLEDRKGIFWSISSIFIHFSFMLPVLILLAWFIVPKAGFVFFIGYLLTAFIVEIKPLQARITVTLLPDILQARVLGYTSDAYADLYTRAQSALNWYVILEQKVSGWFIYLWVISLYIRRKIWIHSRPELFRLFLFALFLGVFTNMLSQIPSAWRFVMLPELLVYVIIIALLIDDRINLNLSIIKYISVPMLIFMLVFNIRVALSYVGALTFFGNPLVAPFFESQTPIIDYVKRIF